MTEALVGCAGEHQQVGARHPFVERRELDLHPLALDPPRLQPVGAVIGPAQVLVDLVQPAVDEEPVLALPGPIGPLATEVDREIAVGSAAGGPVPGHRVGPLPAAVVEPRELLRTAHRELDALDRERPADGAPAVLEGVTEASLTPRHPHPAPSLARPAP